MFANAPTNEDHVNNKTLNYERAKKFDIVETGLRPVST